MNQARWINLVLGVWLFFAPWILGYTTFAARTNDHWVGIGVIAVAVIALTLPTVRFVNTVLGIWCAAAPFVLGYTGAALVNDVVVGVSVLLLSLVGRAWETPVLRRGVPRTTS